MNCTRAFGSVAVVATLALVACGDDDESTDDNTNTTGDTNDNTNNNTGQLSACATLMADKTARLASEIADQPVTDAPDMVQDDPNASIASATEFAGKYRDDLDNHPGCVPRSEYTGNNAEPFSTNNEATVPPGEPATIAGYPCAAKEYDQPNENTSLPIVVLVHGNSSGVTSFEEFANAADAGTTAITFSEFEFTIATSTQEMLATRLLAEGYRVIAFDARVDLVAELDDFNNAENENRNIDHGWAVPMLQSLIKALITNNPEREVSVIGHSLGVTVIRDAFRRLYLEAKNDEAGAVNPFAVLGDVILLSGANHGVSFGDFLCTSTPGRMSGTVTCEMGDRDAFIETYFSSRLNGPEDVFSTPCADGDYAFGDTDACDSNVVEYTTVTMEDLPDGGFQDEFVSEDSSGLRNGACVENALITLSDFDDSGYFRDLSPGFIANHFGSARSPAGIELIVNRLAD